MVQNTVGVTTFTNEADDNIEPKEGWFNRWFPILKWVPTSPKVLKEAEEKFLSHVSTPSRGWYVDIGTINTNPCRIWTRKFGEDSKKDGVPLVLIHGMAAGIAFFSLNVEELSSDRPTYAIDLPGFARSSRPRFSGDSQEAEEQYIIAIEEWRKQVGLEKINLLGHSFGGYLSAAYSLKYPDRVNHLILADPWGMSERPADVAQRYSVPWYIRGLFHVFKNFNPLAVLRGVGPMGPRTITRLRPDISRKFASLFETEEENMKVVPDYMFHCNAQSPTGESAFHSLMTGFAWAKDPMFPRLAQLNNSVPLTALFGANSWIQTISQEDFQAVRKGNGIYTQVQIIPDASHHIYADNSEEFNRLVLQACRWSDQQ